MAAAAKMKFRTKNGKKIPADRKVAFEIDDEKFVMIRPKLLTAIQMMNLAEQPGTARNSLMIGRDLSRLLLTILNYVEPEDPEPMFLDKEQTEPNPKAGQLRGKDRLLERMDDPLDPFDLPDLEPMFREIIGAMFGRPIGAPPEQSTERRDSDGLDSEGGTPSPPAKTSTRSRTARSSSRSATSGSSRATKNKPAAATH